VTESQEIYIKNMKEIFVNLENQTLDIFDMSLHTLIDNEEYQDYFKRKSSEEHYRLLTYLSRYFNNSTFVDVGTLKGSSALALSTNETNKVYSFNLFDELQLKERPKNIEFIVDNVINGKYDNILLESKIILLDTFHNGDFELEFLNHLKNINYKGVLLLDDIFLNDDMITFWNNINEDKLNITNIGHSSGTGVVFLN
jgi:hypothetical protein